MPDRISITLPPLITEAGSLDRKVSMVSFGPAEKDSSSRECLMNFRLVGASTIGACGEG